MRFSQSSHLLMFLSLETLRSILRTGLPTLVELIDLVSSDIIFLSQMTLLRWLTFLLASQSVILTVLLFWNGNGLPPIGRFWSCCCFNFHWLFIIFTTGCPVSSHCLWLFLCWLRWSFWSFEICSIGRYLQT